MKRVIGSIVAVVLFIVLVESAAFTVHEAEQIIITQFGEPVRTVTEPGLHWRMPFVRKVHRMEKRLLPWDGPPEQIPTRDKKRISVDVWARWRIVDPMQYFKANKTIHAGQRILDDLIDSAVRDVVARFNLIDCVRSTREPLRYAEEDSRAELPRQREQIEQGRMKLEELMLTQVRSTVNLKAEYGMEVTDVHLKRVYYIDNVRAQVYERMKSERQRIASLYESEAEEERNRILGSTHKELDQIEGEMEQRSAEIRGDADGQVTKIYAEAIAKGPAFYSFLRRLEAYQSALGGGTKLVLSTDSDFFRLLRDMEAE